MEKINKEIKVLIKKLGLVCTVAEFPDKVNWDNISAYQKLSEDFIKRFQGKFNENDNW